MSLQRTPVHLAMLGFVVAVAAGCGKSGPSKCDRYADKSLVNAEKWYGTPRTTNAEARRKTAKETCERVSGEQVDCLLQATTEEATSLCLEIAGAEQRALYEKVAAEIHAKWSGAKREHADKRTYRCKIEVQSKGLTRTKAKLSVVVSITPPPPSMRDTFIHATVERTDQGWECLPAETEITDDPTKPIEGHGGCPELDEWCSSAEQ